MGKLYSNIEELADEFQGFEKSDNGGRTLMEDIKKFIKENDQFINVDEENIGQWLDIDLAVPGHELKTDDDIIADPACEATSVSDSENSDGEEELVPEFRVPLQTALELAETLMQFLEREDDTSFSEIILL